MNSDSDNELPGDNASQERSQTGAPRDSESLPDLISTSNDEDVDFEPEPLNLRAGTVFF